MFMCRGCWMVCVQIPGREILIKNKKIGNEIIIDDNKNKVANTQKNVALMSKNSSDFGVVILFFH